MAHIIVGIIDILGLLVYLLGPWQIHFIPNQFFPYPYLVGILYIIIVYINYSIYHTSYSLSRNYLIDRDGYDYESRMVFQLQEILEPTWEIYFDILQFIFNLASFFWIMISQGIIPAIAIFVISFGVSTLMSINYPFFLRYIQRHLAALKSEQVSHLQAMDVSIVTLTKNIDEFIRNKINIHDLYTQKMIAAAKKKVESERQ
ncbi:MAG: hypothetical protein A2073_05035 [Deltaproteobacteria bacterium GWC2_42_11]|nr:MAG: hypothetical protein A2073_05035 [Deltaproteobacteria bacterium GWC2_42_11]